MNHPLHDHYLQLLEYGMSIMGRAIRGGDIQWASAEYEMLHNIPSLASSLNPHRHLHYWSMERTTYIQWCESTGADSLANELRRLYYEPVWKEMEPIMTDIIRQIDAAG